MRRNKVHAFFILLTVLLTLCSCGKVNIIEEPEEMPEIVFMQKTKHWRGSGYSIVFLDKFGHKYYMEEPYLKEDWSSIEIYNEFVEGQLDDVLLVKTACDINELYDNYKLLKKVIENENFQLLPDSEYCLDVEEDKYSWIGFYYDEDGELAIIIFRQKGYDAGITHYANDENANKIYEWFTNVSKEKR